MMPPGEMETDRQISIQHMWHTLPWTESAMLDRVGYAAAAIPTQAECGV